MGQPRHRADACHHTSVVHHLHAAKYDCRPPPASAETGSLVGKFLLGMDRFWVDPRTTPSIRYCEVYMNTIVNHVHKSDQRFQFVAAKIATYLQHQYPKQYTRLNHSGRLQAYLEAQAEQAWEQMERAREAGYTTTQAEEFAATFLYPEMKEDSHHEDHDPEDIWLRDRLEKRLLDATGKTVPFD